MKKSIELMTTNERYDYIAAMPVGEPLHLEREYSWTDKNNCTHRFNPGITVKKVMMDPEAGTFVIGELVEENITSAGNELIANYKLAAGSRVSLPSYYLLSTIDVIRDLL